MTICRRAGSIALKQGPVKPGKYIQENQTVIKTSSSGSKSRRPAKQESRILQNCPHHRTSSYSVPFNSRLYTETEILKKENRRDSFRLPRLFSFFRSALPGTEPEKFQKPFRSPIYRLTS